MSTLPMVKAEEKKEYVWLNCECWININDDMSPDVILLQDPTTIQVWKDHAKEFVHYPKGSKIEAKNWNTNNIYGLGKIYT